MSKYLLIMIVTMLFASSVLTSYAKEGDTLVVQTLTFNDITKRRGVWKFPDNTENYRKIIALYTLKCDRQTAQDIFDCGEWDYGANIFIFQPTGIMDSNRITAPKYNWGGGNPNMLYYTNVPTHNTYRKKYTNTVINKVISEKDYVFGNGDKEFTLGNVPTKIQILFNKTLLKEKELPNKYIKRIKVFVKQPGVTLKNLTVKSANTGLNSLTSMFTGAFNTHFEGDITFENAGWNYINFKDPLQVNVFLGFILQLSYDSMKDAKSLVLAADDFTDCLIADEQDSYLEFKGAYDRVDCGVMKQLKGEKKFTIEMMLRLDSWVNGGNIIKIGDGLEFRTVEEYRQPRRYYIKMQDGDDFGIMVVGSVDVSSRWQHFAIVYDGTKGQYDGRIKFYVNGSQVSGHIRGKFPDAFPNKDEFLRLSWTSGNIPGAMDEFRIWKTALEQSEIQEFMNGGIDQNHPKYNDLTLYYSMNNVGGGILPDLSANKINGTLVGTPAVRQFSAMDNVKNTKQPGVMPQITLCEGEYESTLTDSFVLNSVMNPPKSIVTYKLENKTMVIDSIRYVHEPGTYYTYDEDGKRIDSLTVEASDSLVQETITYYSAPFEKLRQREIGRSITPYGINLDLGPNGFTWIYDMTDYAPWLKGEVEMSAHSQLELIDLKFLFIEGTPPREIKKIETLWSEAEAIDFNYASLSNDTKMNEIEVPLLPEAEEFKIRMRMTGHGHNSNDGNYPHCCEWKNNTHYLKVNGKQEYQWNIWKETECAGNPVYPQGGTWPGAREGWCPGDIVPEKDFEITPFVSGNSVKLDYSITPVPENNQGMGGGNYWTTVHFFHYGAANFQNDAEVYNVKIPNDDANYRRINPVCSQAIVVIRNNGRKPLTSLDIEYYVSEELKETFNWKGNLAPHQTREISLPIPNESFWVGNTLDIFTVKVSNPNGEEDEYSANNIYRTKITIPDFYNEKLVVHYRTNARPGDYTVQLRDFSGKIVWRKFGLSANTQYIDTLNVVDGCYTLEVADPNHLGLSYWAYPAQGQGSIRIADLQGKTLKSFQPDFGLGFNYAFNMGGMSSVREPNLQWTVSLMPNPAVNQVTLRFDDPLGETDFEIYNEIGTMIKREKAWIFQNSEKSIDITHLVPGAYFVRIMSGKSIIDKSFVKN